MSRGEGPDCWESGMSYTEGDLNAFCLAVGIFLLFGFGLLLHGFFFFSMWLLFYGPGNTAGHTYLCHLNFDFLSFFPVHSGTSYRAGGENSMILGSRYQTPNHPVTSRGGGD